MNSITQNEKCILIPKICLILLGLKVPIQNTNSCVHHYLCMQVTSLQYIYYKLWRSGREIWDFYLYIYFFQCNFLWILQRDIEILQTNFQTASESTQFVLSLPSSTNGCVPIEHFNWWNSHKWLSVYTEICGK